MDFSLDELRAFKLRFSGTYTNGKLLVFILPNSLIILTFHPAFIKDQKSFDYMGPPLGHEIHVDDEIVYINEEILKCPTQGNVIDVNPNMGDVERFKGGPTSNFILIVKPNKGAPRQFGDDYVKIC
ncbi:hypothetical protein TVAG_089020 [Trichomonas vaginalis G3]|uniref:Uncharacterized protein n=1 Tax=Trichomonas vaginalis (strain ATCC PRA-98 / G3) TaxID=412133 RepID=A2G3L8_TRIV3|nr:hypothetical protein TVAGG3_0963040 [Trichomonas vaginalis G3]EAX88254.1 hypothetical protein TVAG_089020 [Trichomonas vaginalis G3]KAI5488051.1 hypothetical protein TVAGG3_0963040 [Trichomonas vaginalis G3]|eukprot:XP_001301184.1 hypothetical protein [Trichomonas vaginalis G3]